MLFMARNLRNLRWAIVLLFFVVFMLGSISHISRFVHAAQSPSPSTRIISLGAARPDSLYAFTLGLKNPAHLQGAEAVLVTVKDAQGEIESKWLHPADVDFYLTLKPRAAGPVTVSLSADSTVPVPEITASLQKILQAPDLKPGSPAGLTRGVIAVAPNGTWQSARHSNLAKPSMAATTKGPTLHQRARTATRRCSKGSSGSDSPSAKTSRDLSTSC